jgi:hypothetical protein
VDEQMQDGRKLTSMATWSALENWRALVRPFASPMAALISASQSPAGARSWPSGLGPPVAAMSAIWNRVSSLGDDDCLLPKGGNSPRR